MYLVTHLGSNQTFTSCLLNAYHGGVFRNVLLHCDCVRCVRATCKCVRACMVQVRRLQACWYSVCLAQSSKVSRHVCALRIGLCVVGSQCVGMRHVPAYRVFIRMFNRCSYLLFHLVQVHIVSDRYLDSSALSARYRSTIRRHVLS